MSRLNESLLERVEALADRVIRVADSVEKRGVSRRVVDQMISAGTAVGANLFEADEAMSRRDFLKCVSISCKELNETRFWLRLASRNGWVAAEALAPLLDECDQIRRILGSIIARTKTADVN